MDPTAPTSAIPTLRGSYWSRIKHAIVSIMEGMSVTLGYLIQRPITVQYPDRTPKPVKEMLPERYRGILDLNMNICTACLACERACPIGCIKIEVIKDKETKKRYVTRFDIDIAKCMYCGLCVDPCPGGAIHHTKEFEGSTADVQHLVRRFIPPGGRVEPAKPKKKEKKEEAEATDS